MYVIQYLPCVVNTMGVQSEHTHRKLHPHHYQGACPAENFDQRETMNPRGPQMHLFVGSKNTSWCRSQQ
jgi:hypothetical protein